MKLYIWLPLLVITIIGLPIASNLYHGLPWWHTRDQEIDMKGARYEEMEEEGIVASFDYDADVDKMLAEMRNRPKLKWKDAYDNFMFYQEEEGDAWMLYKGREDGEGFILTFPQPILWFSADYSNLTIPRANIKSIKWPKGKIVIEFKEE